MAAVGDTHTYEDGKLRGFPLAPIMVRTDLFWQVGGYTAIPTHEDSVLIDKLLHITCGYYSHDVGFLYKKWSENQVTSSREFHDVEYNYERQALQTKIRSNPE